MRSAFLATLVLVVAGSRAGAESAAVFLDGFFTEWTGVVEHLDPSGDGVSGGIDIRAVDLANDGESLFLRFELTAEISLQEANSLVLYLDTDNNAGTGTPISGIGAELKWLFGARTGTFYRSGGSVSVFQDDIRLRQLPSVTSPVFEVSLGRDVRPDGTNLLFTGTNVRVLLRHEVSGGDQAPNAGSTLTYAFDATVVPPPTPPALARQNASDVRIVTWNVVDLEQNGGGWNAAATPAADRVFSALDPDIVCFQEIYDNSAAATATLLESFLPSGAGQAWYAREVSDCIVVSRFPVLGQWTLDANLGVLLDTDARLGSDLLLVDAHLPCCTNNAGRQAEADRIASFFRDAKTPGGSVTVPFGTVFMIAGDLNLVGLSQQLRTMTDGDIVDNGTFGADFAPDWDGTPLRDLVSSQTEKRFAYTWRNDFGSYAPGRLDFFIYSDSVAEVGNHFVLYTPEMSASQRALYGLQAGDVTAVSDHLPHVADFRQPIATDVGNSPVGAGAARRGISLQAAPPGRRGTRLVLSLDRRVRVRIEVFDVRGVRVATLRDDADLAPGRHEIAWDGRTLEGQRAANGTYVARLTADATGVAIATSTKLTLLR